jgi:hypothetical protein
MKQKHMQGTTRLFLSVLLAVPSAYLANLFVLFGDNESIQKIFYLSFFATLLVFTGLYYLLLPFIYSSKRRIFSKYKIDTKFDNGFFIISTIILDFLIFLLLINSRDYMSSITQDVRFYEKTIYLNKTFLPILIIAYFAIFYLIDVIKMYLLNKRISLKAVLLNFLRVLLFAFVFIFSIILIIVPLFIVIMLTGGGGVA